MYGLGPLGWAHWTPPEPTVAVYSKADSRGNQRVRHVPHTTTKPVVSLTGNQVADLEQIMAGVNNVDFEIHGISAVPEPATWLLLAIGGALACGLTLARSGDRRGR